MNLDQKQHEPDDTEDQWISRICESYERVITCDPKPKNQNSEPWRLRVSNALSLSFYSTL